MSAGCTRVCRSLASWTRSGRGATCPASRHPTSSTGAAGRPSARWMTRGPLGLGEALPARQMHEALEPVREERERRVGEPSAEGRTAGLPRRDPEGASRLRGLDHLVHEVLPPELGSEHPRGAHDEHPTAREEQLLDAPLVARVDAQRRHGIALDVALALPVEHVVGREEDQPHRRAARGVDQAGHRVHVLAPAAGRIRLATVDVRDRRSRRRPRRASPPRGCARAPRGRPGRGRPSPRRARGGRRRARRARARAPVGRARRRRDRTPPRRAGDPGATSSSILARPIVGDVALVRIEPLDLVGVVRDGRTVGHQGRHHADALEAVPHPRGHFDEGVVVGARRTAP